jgi:hypothetical protein
MSRCSGLIGYALAGETQPGVWTENITEKIYYGDVVRDNRRIVDQGEINGSININNNISVVSNKFMLDNLAFMRYITFANSKWKISSVDIRSPRVVITLGGLYNEE